MTEPATQIPPDHPNLVLAVGRLRRLQWIWALLFAALAGLAIASGDLRSPALPLAWLLVAVLLVSQVQPLFLALVSVAWALSLVFLIPGVQHSLGADPLARLLLPGTLETVILAVVRILLLVTAWNQFLFYRMLYGTEHASGLDESLPKIPSVIRCPSDTVAPWARLIGFVGVLLAILAIPLAGRLGAANLLGLAYGCAVFAVGLGLGAAFTPTGRRSVALTGVGLGSASLILALLVARALFSA
jgi:hypothetical protein